MRIKQGGWVLLAALLLVVASLAGLNAYVLAEGETGVQTVSQAGLPKEDSAVDIVWETYDNYYVDMPQYLEDYIGYGLTKGEKKRLAALKEAFSAGTRPEGKLPSMPEETGFAVVPLDPASFAGVEEYYFLPKRELTDEELLQLIAYGEGKGTPFTADILTVKNCMRGSTAGINRFLSAGENERADILFKRFYQEGLLPESSDTAMVTLPISGVTNIPLNRDRGDDLDSFTFLPIRALTDQEILAALSRSVAKGYYLALAQEGLDIKKDMAQARNLLEDVLGMPLAVEEDQMYYSPGETTGSVLFRAIYTRPKINGRQIAYSITLDIATGQCMAINESTDDDSLYYLDYDGSLQYGPGATDPPISDPVDERLVASARAAVEKLTTVKQSRVAPVPGLTIGSPFESDAHLAVFMMDGSSYLTAVRYSDFKTYALEYHPDR